MITDPDERQEYECLRLEGFSEKEARKLARSANDKINSRRLSGPTTGDTRNGHGQRPLVSDLWEYQDHGVSITQDSRSDWERERDWERADFARQCLDMMTPKQRQVTSDYFGLETGSPMTIRQTAEKNGLAKLQKVRRFTVDGAQRVRRQLAVTDVTQQFVGRG